MHADLNPASAKPAEMVFSIFVKHELFTKHFGSQWAFCRLSPSEVAAALQPLVRRPAPEIEKT
jgi:hypothetical protein